jgi:hypothetical protein
MHFSAPDAGITSKQTGRLAFLLNISFSLTLLVNSAVGSQFLQLESYSEIDDSQRERGTALEIVKYQTKTGENTKD